ncbi:MAG: hypothetical protein R2831_04375 [Chitinophagaceae bacterium]
MAFLKKIKDLINPQVEAQQVYPIFTPQEKIKHEFINFNAAYRIGILTEMTSLDVQEKINTYKKLLEKYGYDVEVLMFIDQEELETGSYLQKFTPDDLDPKNGLPFSPKTDRFMVKRFDLLFNLYFNECLPLQYISHMSYAKMRVAPFLTSFEKCADLLIPNIEDHSHENLIEQINSTLKIKPYERKSF